jgi:hypothetical protein
MQICVNDNIMEKITYLISRKEDKFILIKKELKDDNLISTEIEESSNLNELKDKYPNASLI